MADKLISGYSADTSPDPADHVWIINNGDGVGRDVVLGDLPKALNKTNEQTGATYTFVLTDSGVLVVGNRATAQTFTIPADATTNFPLDSFISVQQIGAGAVTIDVPSGVTFNDVAGPASADITARYDAVTIWKKAADTWYLFGGHGGVA